MLKKLPHQTCSVFTVSYFALKGSLIASKVEVEEPWERLYPASTLYSWSADLGETVEWKAFSHSFLPSLSLFFKYLPKITGNQILSKFAIHLFNQQAQTLCVCVTLE